VVALSHPRAARREWRAWVLLAGALGLNCRDGSGPYLGTGQLALVPMFESTSAGQIDFDRIRITLAHPGGGNAVDTVIAIPATVDTVDISLKVPLTTASEEFMLYLRLINAAGDTVLRNDPYPQSVTITAGGSAATPVPITIRATVASVLVTPLEVALTSLGETQQFAASALDDNGNPLVTQPPSFAWSSSAPGVATVDPATGLVTAISTGTTTISATSSGVLGSVLVTVTQLPALLVFTTQPSAAAAGIVIAPPVEVAVQDARGNSVAGFGDMVRVAIGTNPTGSVLAGITDKPAENGVAQFADLSLDQPGDQYTLSVSVSGLGTIISLPFDVRPAPASVYWINPAGGAWSSASNWSTGTLPSSGDNAVITMAGTYSVTLDVDATFAGLTIGGSSGTQTLTVASTTLSVAGNVQVNANGMLQLNAATLNGALANDGVLLVEGSTFVTTPTFTNNGSITVAAGDTLTISNGTFLDDGMLGGAGTLVLTSVVSAAFNVEQTMSAMLVNNSTVRFATPQNTGATEFVFTSSVVNGPGGLTNDAGKTLTVRSTTIGAPLNNFGTLLVEGVSAFNDALMTEAGSLIRLQGNAAFSTAILNVPKGLVNGGTIELTDSASSFGATLKVTGGPLRNAPTGMIHVQSGANGLRTIDATLDNQGTLTADARLDITGASANHLNSGTIKLTGGDVTVIQSGGNPGFTNTLNGIIEIGKSTTLRITDGTVTNALSAKIIGEGAFDVRTPATFTNDGELLPGASPGVLTLAGDPTLSTISTVRIELGGLAVGTEHDQLVVSGDVILNGVLDVTLINGFDPTGLTFTVMTYASKTGAFVEQLPANCSLNYKGSSLDVVC
jgi:hypothetical protein